VINLVSKEWGMTKKGQPYLKRKKITGLGIPKSKENQKGKFKVLNVSMYRKDNENQIEILGTTKTFDTPKEALKFGEHIQKVNSKQEGLPKDTENHIIVASDRIDALKKIQKLKGEVVKHEPNSIHLYVTDGKKYEVE